MPRWSTLSSLVALEFAVACGCAASAHGVAPGASFSRSLAVPAAAATRPARVESKAEDVTLRLTPRFASAPGYIRSIIRVLPNDDNRFLRAEIESDAFSRSSDIQLDGASAAESHFIDWKSLPAGRYELVVSVFGSAGLRAQRRAAFQVFGLGSEP